MEIVFSVWMVLSVILGGLLAFFGILKNANEWFYVRRLGKKRDLLPPGDMGWPFIGTQLSFLKAFKSDNPDSFISTLATRSLSFPRVVEPKILSRGIGMLIK